MGSRMRAVDAHRYFARGIAFPPCTAATAELSDFDGHRRTAGLAASRKRRLRLFQRITQPRDHRSSAGGGLSFDTDARLIPSAGSVSQRDAGIPNFEGL